MKTYSYEIARESYQTKARLVASGRTLSEIAHLTGESLSGLERLLYDPAFRDLVSRYRRAENETSTKRFALLCAA